MLNNYFLIHLRSVLKRPLLTTINILGLTIGIAACLISFLHIQHELSFDKHITNGDKLYRLVVGDVDNSDGWVKVSAPIPPYLKENIPEINNYARLTKVTHNPKVTVKFNDEVFNEENFYMADPALLEMFDLKFSKGSKNRALQDPNNVVISKRISTKYFGESNPIGQTLLVGGEHLYTISGVFEDYNNRSHVDIDFLIDFNNLETIFPGTSLTGNWGQYNYFAYLELIGSEKILEQVVESKIATTVVKLGDNEHALNQVNLQSLFDIHFTKNRGNAKVAYDIKYLFIYAAVALAVLLISIINFINLTIASSTKRIKEVGVRKVVGANRPQLFLQYISESFFTSLLALVAAILLVNFGLLPKVNQILNSHISLDLTNPVLIMTLVITVVIISLLAGFYIAVFVTGFQPTTALRGELKIGQKGRLFKEFLLGTQFVISIALILSSILIYNQMQYLQSKDIGLNPDQVINISLYNKAAKENANLLRERVSLLPFVQAATTTRFIAGRANWHQTTWWEGQETEESMSVILADEGFINTLGLEILEGSEELLTSRPTKGEIRYILNRAALEHIGWDTALGKSMHVFGENSTFPIAGVVEDFNYQSLHQKIDPVIIVVHTKIQPGQLMLKLNTNDYQKAIAKLSEEFKNVLPNTPFEYNFLDDQFAQLYAAESRTKTIIGSITAIAILLALMGLYALVSFAVQERTKELAIRKVLGLHQKNILSLLASGYVKILIIANIITLPLVWYTIDNWLNNFNYRISISPILLIMGSAIVWICVLSTLLINTYQVSRINPVNGLRQD